MRLTQLSALELVGVIGGAIAGVAGAVSGVLAFTGAPQPDPQADLNVTRFEPNVRHAEFARRFPKAEDDAKDPEAVGGILFLDLEFFDFDGRRCRLTWTMHDDADDAPMKGLVYRKAGELDLREPYVHDTPAVWVPAPTRVEDVYVEFRLHDGERPCGSPFRSNTLEIE
jgi:hypothetical protein